MERPVKCGFCAFFMTLELRDLVRARWAAKRDQLRARHRLSKFLLRHGRRAPEGINAWTDRHLQWIRSQVHFEHSPQEITLNDYLEFATDQLCTQLDFP